MLLGVVALAAVGEYLVFVWLRHAGARLSLRVCELYPGPHGVVSPFEPGMAVLLAAFLAVGGQSGAFAGFFALEVAGLVLVHQRASSLCRLGWRAQVLLGVAFAFNQLGGWDPAAYPGWWSGLDRLLPEFVVGPRVLGLGTLVLTKTHL